MRGRVRDGECQRLGPFQPPRSNESCKRMSRLRLDAVAIAKDRFSRSLRRVRDWCRQHRHAPVGEQHRALSRKLNGHFGYFGVRYNVRTLYLFKRRVIEVWRKWLSRRSQKAKGTWAWMRALLKKLPLPKPRIVVRYELPPRLPPVPTPRPAT